MKILVKAYISFKSSFVYLILVQGKVRVHGVFRIDRLYLILDFQGKSCFKLSCAIIFIYFFIFC